MQKTTSKQSKHIQETPREHNLQTYYGRSLAGGQPGRNFPKERGASEIFLRGPNTRKLQASKASTCKKQQRQTKNKSKTTTGTQETMKKNVSSSHSKRGRKNS